MQHGWRVGEALVQNKDILPRQRVVKETRRSCNLAAASVRGGLRKHTSEVLFQSVDQFQFLSTLEKHSQF